jgi:hypothetical protein
MVVVAGKTESKSKLGRSVDLGCEEAVLCTPDSPSLFARYCAVQQGVSTYYSTVLATGLLRARKSRDR